MKSLTNSQKTPAHAKRTCSQFYRAVKEKYPEKTAYLEDLLKEKQERMIFLNRCMGTQSAYENHAIKKTLRSETARA